jgi:hypothetical protein
MGSVEIRLQDPVASTFLAAEVARVMPDFDSYSLDMQPFSKCVEAIH